MESSSDGDLEDSKTTISECKLGQLNLITNERNGENSSEIDVNSLTLIHGNSTKVQTDISGIDHLPKDVLLHCIFKYMNLLDLLKIDSTCKRWFRIIGRAIVEYGKMSDLKAGCRLYTLLRLLTHCKPKVQSQTSASLIVELDNSTIDVHPVRSLIRTRELTLFNIEDDTQLRHLVMLSNLKKLNLAFAKLTSVGIENISRFKNLTHLSLYHCGYDRTCLSKISQFKKLDLVQLQLTSDTPRGIHMALKGLPITVPLHAIPP